MSATGSRNNYPCVLTLITVIKTYRIREYFIKDKIEKGVPGLTPWNENFTIPLRYILFFTLFLCKKQLNVFYSIDCYLQLSYNLGINF